MNEYVLVTDACADMDSHLAENMGIRILPMDYHLCRADKGDEEDNKKNLVSSSENMKFYDFLRKGDVSYTKPVKETEVSFVFKSILETGKDILYLAASTYLFDNLHIAEEAAAALRKQFPDRNLLLTDTQMSGVGQEALVWYAAQQKQKGVSIQNLWKWIEETKNKVFMWYTAKDYSYLGRRGSLSTAAAMLRTLDHIKPVWKLGEAPVNFQEGIQKLMLCFEKAQKYGTVKRLFISHGDCEEQCEEVCRELMEKYDVVDIQCHKMTPVLGGCFGPDTILLACVPGIKERRE